MSDMPQEYARWQISLLTVLQLDVLLPEIYLINNMGKGEMGYRDGSWVVLANDPVQWWALVWVVLKLWILLTEI